jgi:iron complex outermembrane recepter protein
MSVFKCLLTATALCSAFTYADAADAQMLKAERVQDQGQDEIIITAQKRREPLSKTPLSVAIITGEHLNRSGAYDLKDAQILTSSLLIISTANEAQTTARLRGVGTVGDNPGLESSVGVVIDGVVRARTATAMGDLGRVERIEILKGPQTSLFGKGASAGIIQAITKTPGLTPESGLELSLGEHGTKALSGYLDGPLNETVAGSLSLVKRQRDGQYRISLGDGPRDNRRDNDQNYYSVRGQLVFLPSSFVKMRLIADYTQRDENCCSGTAIFTGPAAISIDAVSVGEGVVKIPNPRARQAWLNRSTAQDIVDQGLSFETNIDLNEDLSLTAITAARNYKHTSGYDGDFSGADILYREPGGPFGNEFNTLSQEVRLNGKSNVLTWLAGVYLASEDLTRHYQEIYGSDYEPYLSLRLSGGTNIDRISQLTGLGAGQSYVSGQGANDVFRQTERNIALFGNADVKLTDRLTMVLGARFNRQTKTLNTRHSNSDGGRACRAAQNLGSPSTGTLCLPWSNWAFNDLETAQRLRDEALTGTLKLKFQITPKIMSYASVTRGQKGGGFNLDREQNADLSVDKDTSFAPETVSSQEVGLKGRWLKGRLSLDVAAFNQAFENFQLNTFLGTTFLVRSVPHLTSRGIEAEGSFDFDNGFKWSGGATFAEAQFGPQPVAGLALLPNARASFAPKWSVASQMDYIHDFEALRLKASLDARFNSAYNTGSDLARIKVQPDYTLFNGRVSFERKDGRLGLDLWGQNLTDETYYQVVFGAPLQTGSFNAFLGQPRTLGITLRLRH